MKSIIAIVCLIGFVACQTGPVAKPAAAAVDTTKPTKHTVQTVNVKPAGCYPLCKTPLETCVRLAKCRGNDCFQCAMTASIVLPTTKMTTTTVEKKGAHPFIIPGVNLVSSAGIPADLQAMLQAQQIQQMQQSQQTGGFRNSADPFQNMMMGSMLFDGGMGFGW